MRAEAALARLIRLNPPGKVSLAGAYALGYGELALAQAEEGGPQRSGHLSVCHIDFRSHGGYIVAPPSTVNGRRYIVINRQPSEDVFDWGRARELLGPQARRRREAAQRAGGGYDPGQLAAWVAAQPMGNRNAGLFWAASRAIEAGHADAFDGLARAARSAGLTAAEASRTIRSAQRRAAGAAEPPSSASGRDRESAS